MKNLQEFIAESSLLTQIKYASKRFMNNVRTLFGAKEKTYRPYITINKDTGWTNNGEKNFNMWTKEAEYLFMCMKEFLDNTGDYITRKTNYDQDENKATIIEYSYSNMDKKEVRKKIWDKLCKLISDINDELGTDKIDLSKVPDYSTSKEKYLPFPEEHKKYKIIHDSNNNLTSTWEWYWIEMQCDEDNNSSYVENGYYFYPGAMFKF